MRETEWDRDRGINWTCGTPGIAYRQHLLYSVVTVVHRLVSASQVVPLIHWSLKPTHVWSSLRSEYMNNELVS